MKRIFISFAIEDFNQKILFTGQAKNNGVPFEYTDMSVKIPWESSWKSQCRERIKSCRGVIVLVSNNLKNADVALWEIKCAKEELKPIYGIYIESVLSYNIPTELQGINIKAWTWENVKSFIDLM